jgi:hypothetical protein
MKDVHRVFKYKISPNEGETKIPFHAVPLCVGVQEYDAYLWAEVQGTVDDHNQFDIMDNGRYKLVYPVKTGYRDVPKNSTYVGTVQVFSEEGERLTRHVYVGKDYVGGE